jgi:hypothetical protein
MVHADLWILICAILEYLTVKYGKRTRRPKTERGENSKQEFPSDGACSAAWASKLYSTNAENGGVMFVSHYVTEQVGPNCSASDLYSGKYTLRI